MQHDRCRIYRVLVIAALGIGINFGSHAVKAVSPNLLIIQTDEHNFRTLGCYRETLTKDQALVWGNRAIVETPAIDSIAARGAICTSFYATSPVCTPSRASFFTGLYPQHTGSPQNNRPLRGDVVTIAKWLHDRGYATGYAGKWHLNGSGKPEWQPSRPFGFVDNRFMFNRGHWKKFEIVDGRPRVASRNGKGQPTYGVNDADSKSFSTDWLTERAIDFISEHHRQPFCYHLSLPDPHGPNTVRPPYDSMFADMAIRPPKTFAMTKQNPGWASATGNNAARRFNPALMQQYFGMVKCIDDNVARLLETLDRHDLTEQTFVVFTSDHGDLCFEHGRLNKGNPYEGSAKIPMIVAAPSVIPAGTRIDQALGTVDFMPTILSLMNEVTDDDLTAPDRLHGRNAASLFRGQDDVPWEDMTVVRAAGDSPSWIAVISDRFKLVYSQADQPWLFDLQSDPDELENHFSDPDHRRAIRRMTDHLIGYAKRYDDQILKSGKLRGLSDLAADGTPRPGG